MRTSAERSHRWWFVLRAALLAAAVALPFTASAQDPVPCQTRVLTLEEAAALLRVDTGDLELLAESGGVPGRRIGSSWRFDCAAVITWLGTQSRVPRAETLTTGELAKVVGRDTVTAQSPPPQGTPADSNQNAAIGEAPEERTAEDVFLRGNRVLLGPGDVVLDFGQFYTRSDAIQLAASGGTVGLATLEQSALTTLLVARVGVFHETELFASASFSKQNQRQRLGGVTLGTTGRSAPGGSTIGIRHTFLHETVRRPDVVLTFSGAIPTGDTVAGMGGGIVVVKSLDPVVLFANANYVHPFTKPPAAGGAAVTDAVDLSVGYGLGLNDSVAISMGIGGLFVGTPNADAASTRPASIFSARFGVTTSVGEGFYLEPSVSFGLSGPGQRFAFGVTMPFAF